MEFSFREGERRLVTPDTSMDAASMHRKLLGFCSVRLSHRSPLSLAKPACPAQCREFTLWEENPPGSHLLKFRRAYEEKKEVRYRNRKPNLVLFMVKN